MSWWRRADKRLQGPAVAAPSRIGLSADPIEGVDPAGRPVRIDFHSGAKPTALLFLTTSCASCRSLWAHAATRPNPGVWIVTPSPETESRAKARDLGHPSAQVVMSSPAWHQFGVTGSPWLIVIGSGQVVADNLPVPESAQLGLL